MATLTSPGLNSGIDINGLVSQLVAAEAAPAQQQFFRQETRLTAQLSALGTLRSAMAALKSSLDGLNEAADFGLLTATSSREDLFSATASTGAVTGQYAVEVSRIAQYHKLASATLAADTVIGGSAGDQLSLMVDGQSIDVDLSQGKTLAEIRDAVNESAGNPGVTATLINVTDVDQALVLTSADTGYVHRIEATETITSGGTLAFATANLDATGAPLVDLANLDASVRLDGLQITRPGNEITDAIEGVSITLHQAEAGAQASLRVEPDKDAVTASVTAFVDKYNALVRTLDAVSGYRGEDVEQPVLFGDAMTRSIGSRLRSELGQAIGNLSGAFSRLAEIGVDTNTDGTLVLDRTKLSDALAQDLSGVGELFFSEHGFATRIDALLASYVDANGVLELSLIHI